MQVNFDGEAGAGYVELLSGDRQTVRATVLPVLPISSIYMYPFDSYQLNLQ